MRYEQPNNQDNQENQEKEYNEMFKEVKTLYEQKEYIKAYKGYLELIDNYGEREELIRGIGWSLYYIGIKFKDLISEGPKEKSPQEDDNIKYLLEITGIKNEDELYKGVQNEDELYKKSLRTIFEKAEKYFRRLLKIGKNKDNLTSAYSGLPLVLAQRYPLKVYNSDKEAQALLKEAKKIVNKGLKRFKNVPNILNTKGLVLKIHGEYYENNKKLEKAKIKYKEARETYEKGLRIALKKNDYRNAGHNSLNIAKLLLYNIYPIEKNPDILNEAEEFARKAIEYYKKLEIEPIKNIEDAEKRVLTPIEKEREKQQQGEKS